MVLNQDYESDEDMTNEWEIVSEDERQKEQKSLLDDYSYRVLSEQTRSNIADEAENATANTTSEEKSKEIDNSSGGDNAIKNKISIVETRNTDRGGGDTDITTPLIAEANETPQSLESNVHEMRTVNSGKNKEQKQKKITPSDGEARKEKEEEMTAQKEKNDSTPTPKRFPFFWGAARRLADTVIDIEKKHQVRKRAQNTLKTAETSAQHVCDTIGGAVTDIDKKHQVRKRAENSFIGKSARDVGKKIGDTVMDVDKKHQVLKRTESSLKAVGTSARNVSKKISNEVKGSTRTFGHEIGAKTSKVKERIQRVYDEKNVEEKAKNTAEKIKTTTKKAGQKARHFNEEYHVTEVLGTAAILGVGLFLAKGNIQAGATAAATGGAIYMAGESMKPPYRHDSGLDERMHMD